MDRFDQELLFDRLAASNHLDLDLMRSLARSIATFHLSAEVRHDHGGRAGIAWVVEGNAAGFAEFGAGALDPASNRRLTESTHSELERHGVLLDRRRQAGWVRQCHGDLHLRNIVLMNGEPTLFDGVEFNDEISCIDVLYDLAFLLMDLWRRGLAAHANIVMNHYLSETGDLAALELLPLFLSCRAAVRAKTRATAARMQTDVARRREPHHLASEYLSLAQRFLDHRPACLIAIGGLSGSGKSTVALALSPSIGPAPGAMLFRSDEVRKRVCGVPRLQPLGPEGYAPAVSERVYDVLVESARATIQGGHAAIVDAVFADAAHRRAIEQLAADASVPFIGCWLEAPASTLVARAEGRRHDPSDATAAVVRLQHAQDTGSITWHRVDASQPRDMVIEQVKTRLSRDIPDAVV